MFKLRWKLLPILATLFMFNSIYAQSVKIDLSVKNESLKQFIKQIEAKTDYTFMLDQTIDQSQTVTVDVRQESLDAILKKAFAGKKVSYEIVGRQIILKLASPNQRVDSRKITGIIKDQRGEPIIGANVILKGTTNGVISDIYGVFEINAPMNAVLQISYIGYLSTEMKVGKDNHKNVVLKEDTQTLDEVVVIGYTAQKKGLLTGSIVSMNVTDDLKNMSTASAGNLLVGKLSGVDVSTANGIPGERPKITIRTKSSLNDQDVTYVIDGIIRDVTDFQNMSPNEISNITVLKDAASAAIYGSRSTGGVVLITTKRGEIGKPKFAYSYSFGVDTRTKNVDMTSAVETGELYARINGSSDPAGWAWSQDEIDYYKTVNDGWGYDQLETVWRNPSIQTHNLSVNGGSEKVKYFGGVSYVNQRGFLKPLSFEKFNFRLNTTVDVTDDLQFFAGMALNNNNKSNELEGDAGGIYAKLLRWQPDQPVFTDGGVPIDYGWMTNVGARVNGDGGYNQEKYLKPQIVLNVTYKLPFLKGLSAKASYGSNWTYNRKTEFRKIFDMALMKKEGTNNRIIHTDDASIIGYRKTSDISKDKLEKKVDWAYNYQLNFQLDYNRTFNNVHSVQGALVFEKGEWNDGQVYGGRERFPVYLTDQFWAASSSRADTWGGGNAETKNGRVSYIGQFNYSYANKYLLNFSFREDGSMKFASDQRWGFFPAGSMGWVVSEESFFNHKTIDYLKLRASVGLTGNDGVGGWLWQESYEEGKAAYFGSNPSRWVGIKYGTIPNPLLTWEKSLSYNVGVDMNLLSHWNLTAEYWFRKTYDILGDRNASVPTTYNRKVPKENYAQINAQGFDLNVGYNNRFGKVDFHGNLALSYGWNESIIEDYAENAKWIDIPVGKSKSNHKGYRFDQILRTQEQLDKFIEEHPGYRIGGQIPELGMMVYKDISGPDGKPDNVIDSWDKVILVAKNFPVVYGLNLGAGWNGFSLDMMFSGKLHEQKSFKNLAEGVEWNRMWSEWYDNSWTPENTDAWLPKRISSGRSKTYTEDSDFWLKKINFIRLKYLNIGYTIPQKVYGGVFDRVKLFFSGSNLFALSNFSYYDPEIGGGYDFPVMRSYSFGIDVTF